MLEEAGLYDDNVKMLEEKLAAEGKTPLFFACDGILLGIIALADRVKPTSRAAIEEMKRMGLEVVMLTGDNARTAQAIQKEVGADRVVAEVLPQDKETEIRRLQQQGKKKLPWLATALMTHLHWRVPMWALPLAPVRI